MLYYLDLGEFFVERRYDFHLKRLDQIVTGTLKAGTTVLLAIMITCSTSLYTVAKNAERLVSANARISPRKALPQTEGHNSRFSKTGSDRPTLSSPDIDRRQRAISSSQLAQKQFAQSAGELTKEIKIPIIGQQLPVAPIAAPSIVGGLLFGLVAYFHSARKMALRELGRLLRIAVDPPLDFRLTRHVVLSPSFWIAPLPPRLSRHLGGEAGTHLSVFSVLGWSGSGRGKKERLRVVALLTMFVVIQGWLASLSLMVTIALGKGNGKPFVAGFAFVALQLAFAVATLYVSWLWVEWRLPRLERHLHFGPDQEVPWSARRITRRRFVQFLGAQLGAMAISGMFTARLLLVRRRVGSGRYVSTSLPDGFYRRPLRPKKRLSPIHWVKGNRVVAVGEPYSTFEPGAFPHVYRPIDLSDAERVELVNIKEDERVDWAVYSRCFEWKACECLEKGNYDDVRKLLWMAVHHDLDKRNRAQTQPNWRVYDLLAVVLLRRFPHELDNFAKQFENWHPNDPQGRAKKWRDPNGRWKKGKSKSSFPWNGERYA